MKRFTFIGMLFLAILITSCSGNDGFDGQDGLDSIQGQVFEVENVDFNYDATGNFYSTRLTYSDFTSFEVLESDAVLLYVLDEEIELTDGLADNWTLVPVSYFLDGGTIQYTYAHNFVDMDLYINGNFDMSAIDTFYTDDLVFRVVILPSSFASSKIDTSDINAVLARLGVEEDDIIKASL
ncbi:collagen-like protein [Cellulophaga baltica]|uniref:collagen-like protein n=1 Tax=Cellulophaga TaxID=104264 RepID=UPI001C07BDB0|nr:MULTISPECIES: collagen-like protein [Cellulophaga]MBU2994889.1 collagen-like protein [Cellulophaga baltica]MDO6766283.1 collagen-like protein [Cellulophaga sp. 1_MG-2023]